MHRRSLRPDQTLTCISASTAWERKWGCYEPAELGGLVGAASVPRAEVSGSTSLTPCLSLPRNMSSERRGPGLGHQLLSGVGKTAPVPRSSEAGCVTAPQAEAPGRPGARSLAGLASHVYGGAPALPCAAGRDRSPGAGASAASSERPRLLNRLSGPAGTDRPRAASPAHAVASSGAPASPEASSAFCPRVPSWRRRSCFATFSRLRGFVLLCPWMAVSPSFPPSEPGRVRAVSPRFQERPVRLPRGPLARGEVVVMCSQLPGPQRAHRG